MARILNKPVAFTDLRNLTLDSIIHLLLFSYFLIGLFFPYANQLGIKWQLIAPLIIPIHDAIFLFKYEIDSEQTNRAFIFFCFQFLSFLFNSL